MYGKMFNGTWVRSSADERDHAQHLLSDGGVTCDCQGVVARNGKFQALPFAGRGDPLYLWPSDLIEETTEEPTNVMNWREY